MTIETAYPVLVVCLDRQFSKFIGEMLRHCGVKNVTFSLMTNSIFEYRSFGLIVYDMDIPGNLDFHEMRSLEALHAFASDGTPVVVLASYISETLQEEIGKNGAAELLIKPFSSISFRQTIFSGLKRRAVPSNVLAFPSRPGGSNTR